MLFATACRQKEVYLSAAAAVKSPVEQGSLGVDVIQHGPGVVGHGGREDDGVVIPCQGLEKRIQPRSLVHL